jgi:hypothetical protein
MFRLQLTLALVLTLAAPRSSTAKVHDVATRDEFVAALAAAQPGDEIRIAPGTYHGGIHHAGLHGTEAAPIVIAAADPADPPRFEGGGSGLHLSSPEHVELRDLAFIAATGNGLNIDDSGPSKPPPATSSSAISPSPTLARRGTATASSSPASTNFKWSTAASSAGATAARASTWWAAIAA